jgi:hypothetical protein
MSDTGLGMVSTDIYFRIQSSKISEKWPNDVTEWRHISNTRHGVQKLFFQNIPLIIFNNFNYDRLVMKTKFKGLHSNKVVRFLKNDQMTSLNDVICPTLGMVCKNFFSEYSSYHIQQLQLWSTCHENQV